MKTKSKKKFSIVLVTLLAVLILGGVGAGAYVLVNTGAPEQQNSSDTPTNTDDRDDDLPIKEQPGTGKDPVGNQDDDNTQKPINLTITSANVTNGELRIRTIIDKVTTSGTCKLSLAKSGEADVKTYSSGVEVVSSYSSCNGFDINVADFESGSWTATLTFTDGDLFGSTKTIVEI